MEQPSRKAIADRSELKAEEERWPQAQAPSPRLRRREVAIERIVDAPRRLVFKAWTERRHPVRWSAPHGFTVTHCEGELRPGGAWRWSMGSPEGVDYRRGGTYREIVEPERHGDTTKVTFRQTRFTQAASRDRHREGRVKRLERLAG